MRVYLFFMTLLLLGVGAGCSTTNKLTGQCDTSSLEQVIADPMLYAGQRFCGEVIAARPALITRIMANVDDVEATGTVLAASATTEHLLGSVGPQPTRYRIEAKIVPMAECFQPERNANNECVPYARPVALEITKARLLP